ncbi:hypothetical protein RHGRI_018254 [Rhododendron griersonianum]|uniref:Transmembrane protein n=1 Tax=Rhododendron griersonianum TaxID=479676 RepID=A0AAV6K0X3_9ERIC|nr:hypothetical protein RHGRI_018254 [Rhododendron griersonianum]
MAELSRTHLLTILVLSFTIASILITLPAQYEEEEEENRRGGTTTTTTRTRKPTLVPTVIFNTLPPSTFQAFVIALVFAFASSLSALLIHDAENHNGKRGRISRLVTRLFGCVSLASITFALAILSWALLLTAAACWPSCISRSLLDLPKR